MSDPTTKREGCPGARDGIHSFPGWPGEFCLCGKTQDELLNDFARERTLEREHAEMGWP